MNMRCENVLDQLDLYWAMRFKVEELIDLAGQHRRSNPSKRSDDILARAANLLGALDYQRYGKPNHKSLRKQTRERMRILRRKQQQQADSLCN